MPETKVTGKNIESYCVKCKQNRDHTIMIMDGEEIGKVRCQSCGGSHKYRNPVDALKIRKTRPKKNAGAVPTAEMVWQAGLAGAKGKERDYTMTAKYRIGDIVNHQTFGIGIVMKLYSNKCDMLFKDKERLMASTNQ